MIDAIQNEEVKTLSQEQVESLRSEYPDGRQVTYDSLFDMLFCNLDLLSDEEMEEALPIRITYSDVKTNLDLEAAAMNWALFVAHRILAIQWFKRVSDSYPGVSEDDNQCTFMINLFESFTQEQKAVLEQGYDILHFDCYPPLLDGGLYELEFEKNENLKSEYDFPIRRIQE